MLNLDAELLPSRVVYTCEDHKTGNVQPIQADKVVDVALGILLKERRVYFHSGDDSKLYFSYIAQDSTGIIVKSLTYTVNFAIITYIAEAAAKQGIVVKRSEVSSSAGMILNSLSGVWLTL